MAKALSIYDLAKELGISSGTVSRAFNNHPDVSKATRERILKKAEELGYVPSQLARGLARNVVHAVGIVIPTVYDPFFLDFAQGVQEVATESGVSVMMSFTDHQPETLFAAVQSFERFRVAGILLMGGSGEHDDEIARIVTRTPVVVALRRSLSGAFPAVYVDHERGAFDMTSYLAKKSAGTVAYVSLPLATQAAKERLEGYRRAMAEAGDIGSLVVFAKDNGFLDGVAATTSLLNHPLAPEVDSVFYASDALATGGLSALAEAGQAVPSRIRVAGFGDIASSSVTQPSLTTVHVPMREIGEQSLRQLLGRMKDPAAESADVVLESRITERASA